MVVPFGEALIHTYYWEGLARLSRLDTVEAVGAQTNLSFSVEKMLNTYNNAGGKMEKLRLWATYHPEMVTVKAFSKQCSALLSCGISVCAGAVGVPENISLLNQLRDSLPDSIYLWVNRMDGLKRRYTPEEEKALEAIDPLFSQELHWPESDPSQCRDRLFVEADGSLRRCNIGKALNRNWYDKPTDYGSIPDSCHRARCSCYLAYGGRADFAKKSFFGRYPAFRIPWRPKAVFLDLDGTLLPEKAGAKISAGWLNYIRQESRIRKLFFATSLPERDALSKCPEIVPYLSGGIYASGAHIVLYGQLPGDENHGSDRQDIPGEEFCVFDAPWLSLIPSLARELGFRVQSYLYKEKPYKVTLVKPARRGWRPEEISAVSDILPANEVRVFVERGCLQIVAADTDKGAGVRRLCGLLGISPSETAAVGNSPEDIPMFRACGFGLAVAGSPETVRMEADIVIDQP